MAGRRRFSDAVLTGGQPPDLTMIGGQPPNPRSLTGKMKMRWSMGEAHV